MRSSVTIDMDVLHNSILGEKDEPITVINLLHIKANVLKQLFCAAVLFSGGRTSKTRESSVPFLLSLSSSFKDLSRGISNLCLAANPSSGPLGLPRKPPWLQGRRWTEHPHLFRAAQSGWI